MRLPEQELVIVLDFGGQYSHLIARRIRELKVFCEMLPFSTSVEEIKKKRPRGIVFSGGPSSVCQDNAPVCDPAIYELGIPVLGICYGMQLMARHLGGRVSPANHPEYGKTELIVLDRGDILSALGPVEQCWMSHGDLVESAPQAYCYNPYCKAPVAAMAQPGKIFTPCSHPEVAHTTRGQDILKLSHDVCGRGLWDYRFLSEGLLPKYAGR